MFELDKCDFDSDLHRESPAQPAASFEPVADVEGVALLLWGEHCIECAVPACYSTCNLYQPRSDLRCRRFQFGCLKNEAFKSIRGYGVEISFKKWAKLEAFGSTAIYPLRTALRWERRLERLARLTDLIGKTAYRLNGNHNWAALTYELSERLVRALNRRASDRVAPDDFLLEIYNPMAQEARLQLIFSVCNEHSLREDHHTANAGIIPPVIHTLALAPGYSCNAFAVHSLDRFLLPRVPFSITLVPEADSNARLVFLCADFVKYKRRPVPQHRGQIKCVVWDLDNTLWDGVLIEGDQVKLRAGIPHLLKYLDERGILLSIASNNDHQSAWQELTRLGVADYFLYPQIDWTPKSRNISAIARQLGIGLDTLAFVDDNPFELDEVASTLPGVARVRAEDALELMNDPRFRGDGTEESRLRRRYYKEQIVREEAAENFASDYLSFLASCEITLELSGYSETDCERVAELVQRTNQLNFSGRKYSARELEEIIADAELEKYVLRCRDKYGAYGTIGFAIVRPSPHALQILDFMLSCRVQRKGIEQAFFSHLLIHHNRGGAGGLWINYSHTERNIPARGVLESLGFQPGKTGEVPGGGGAGMVLDAPTRIACDFIEVRCAATGSAHLAQQSPTRTALQDG
jgi:FkbH-like protein